MKKDRQELLFYFTMFPFKKKIDEMRKVTEKTAWILANYPFTRNSDKALIFKYWREADKIIEVTEENYDKLTIAESITRSRRKLQNELGLYLPTDEEIIEQRRINEDAVRSWAIWSKKDGISSN